MASLSQLALYAFGILLCYQLLRTLYNVYLGSLSGYPGPKFAAASRFPIAWQKLRGTEVVWFHKLHLRYGPVVRTAPTELSYVDARAWKEIYGQYNGVANGVKTGQLQKDPTFYGSVPPGYLELINANDVDHARMRRNFSNAFSDKALRSQEPMIQRYIDQLVSKLKDVAERPGNTIDFVKYTSWTTFDIMADLTSGEPLGCLDREADHPWVTKIFSVFRFLPAFQEISHRPLLAYMIGLTLPKSVDEDRMIHYRYSSELVEKRLAKDEERLDIWGITMNAKDDYRLTKPEMYGNSRLFMTAGTETTASLLCGLYYYLNRNPEQMSALVTEVRTSFPSSKHINADTLSELTYLNACIEEGLRMFPPIPTFLPRLIPKGGSIICERFVPEHTAVYIHQYAAYRSPSNFKHPDRFEPRRWLGDVEYASDNRQCLQPFSVGPRNCVGKKYDGVLQLRATANSSSLAYLEMRLILANLIWHFDLSLGPDVGDWLDQKVFLAWEKPVLPITVREAQSVD